MKHLCNMPFPLILGKGGKIMAKGILKVIEETETGRNVKFQNTGNNEILTANELVKRLETGNSVYNENYYIKNQDGEKFVVSKPDGNKENNLG